MLKTITSVIFIECTGIKWGKRNKNGLCVSVFIKYMGLYLGLIGRIHDSDCLIYIFTSSYIDGNPKVFNNSQYNCWFE